MPEIITTTLKFCSTIRQATARRFTFAFRYPEWREIDATLSVTFAGPVNLAPGPLFVDQSQLRQRQRKLHASHEQSLTRLPLELLNGRPEIPRTRSARRVSSVQANGRQYASILS